MLTIKLKSNHLKIHLLNTNTIMPMMSIVLVNNAVPLMIKINTPIAMTTHFTSTIKAMLFMKLTIRIINQ
jgi:hypothetical protein